MTMLWSFDTIAVVHLAATGFMVGLIWTIHVVHYPLFSLVNEPYRPFQEAHMSRITGLLIVPWGAETLSAAALVMTADAGSQRSLSLVGLALVVAVVLVTGLGAAPIHGKLVDAYDEGLHSRLMRVDLVRALLWTARLIPAGWLVLTL